MRRIALVLVSALALGTASMAAPNGGHGGGHASAAGGFHGGASHGNWHGGGGAWHGGYHRYGAYYGGFGWGLGWGLGWGWWGWPAFYSPYYYDNPFYYGVTTYQYETPAPVTVQTAPQPGAPSYYYCTNPAGYYPAVGTCQVPWQAVPVAPQGVVPQ